MKDPILRFLQRNELVVDPDVHRASVSRGNGKQLREVFMTSSERIIAVVLLDRLCLIVVDVQPVKRR